MKVTFVLPDYSLSPVGGFKIVYLYANTLSRFGHHVNIVYADLARRSRALWIVRAHILRRLLPPWYQLDGAVCTLFRAGTTPGNVPDADVVLATGVQTASYVAGFPASAGDKYFFIQHFEDWVYTPEQVRLAWRLPLKKIVISRWLEEAVAGAGAGSPAYLPNPFENSIFFVTNPPEHRPPESVCMMWSTGSFKRSTDGLEAVIKAKQRLPELRCTFFSAEARPRNLPQWIEYVRGAHGGALREVYNQHAMFLHTSETEGSPLPPGEAMACGCAVVSTRNDGVMEYASDHNARLVPVGDVDGMSESIVQLSQDRAERLALARAGYATAGTATVEERTAALVRILRDEQTA